MSARGPLVAVGGALALALVYWGWVVKLQPQRQAAADDAKLLFKGLDPGGTNEILLRKKGEADVLLRKVDGRWRLITPTAAPADQDAVASLVSELAAAKRDEIVVAKGADPHDFGLDAPSGEVTFRPSSPSAKAQVLFFGMNSPSGNEAYGMIDGRPEVFLTDLYVKNAVLKSAADLRDKTVWTFDPADIEALRSGIGGFSLSRDKQGLWRVDAGARHEPAKGPAVDEWLSELSRLKADSVPSETGRGSFGLGHARALALTLKNGARLVLKEGGKSKPAPGVYAQLEGQGPVFQLSQYAAGQLEKKSEDLMDLDVFSFDPGAVTRFEVKRPHGTLVALKKAGIWSWDPARPGDKGFDFNAFLSALSTARVLKRLDKAAAPTTPTATVGLYGEDGSLLEKAAFGARLGKGQVAASFTKSQVSVASARLLDTLPPDLATAPAGRTSTARP